MRRTSASARPILTPTRAGSGPDPLDQAAHTGAVRPRPETAARAVGPDGRLELGPGRPVVGRPPAGREVPAVAPLERDVHLEPAVVAVPGVGGPGALVAVDAEECAAERHRHGRPH